MIMIICGIYKYTSPSGKIYIGSSKNINKRITYYKSESCKNQTKLYNSFKKYGYENHIFEIIEECKFEDLYLKERYYGELFNVLDDNGLNLILPKIGENKIGISEETRLKMSESKKGDKNIFYGKKHSEETKEKMRKPKSDETKQKMKEAKLNSPIRICTHCGREGRGGNMTRYHFDNCKRKG